MMHVQIDRSTLRKVATAMSELANVSGIALGELVRQQAALFQRDAVLALPPKSREKAIASARRHVRAYVNVLPESGRRLRGARAKSPTYPLTRWLFAMPWGLYGATTSMMHLTRDIGALLRAYRTVSFAQDARSPKWQEVGVRGRQKIYLSRRPVMSRSGFGQVVNFIRQRLGRLKASLAVGWKALQTGRRLPQWVARHVDSARGAVDIQQRGHKSGVVFRSWAYGITHPQAMRALRRALMTRLYAMRARIEAEWERYLNRHIRFRVRPGGRKAWT